MTDERQADTFPPISLETSPDLTSDARELSDDELDSVAGGFDGIKGEAVKLGIPTKLSGAVQTDTFPTGVSAPSLIGKF